MPELYQPRLDTDRKPEELTFYSDKEYYSILRDKIDATVAGDRVGLLTFSLDPIEPKVREVIDSMYAAAERNVDVHFGVDSYAFLVDGKSTGLGPMFYRGNLEGRLSPTFQRRLEAVRGLGNLASGRSGILNQPNRRLSKPIAGRSHLKVATVNDWVSLGGCNMLQSDRMDTMVGFNGTEAANWVHDIITNVVSKENTNIALGDVDKRFSLGPNTDLLVDVGVPDQSIILDETLRMIEEAEEWIMLTCQFFPAGITMEYLDDALKRKVQVDTFYNRPNQLNSVMGLWQHLVLARERRRWPAELMVNQLPLGTPMLHSKVLATEKEAELGTHNLIEMGVKHGTPEINLVSRDPAISRRLGRFMVEQIGVSDQARFGHLYAQESSQAALAA